MNFSILYKVFTFVSGVMFIFKLSNIFLWSGHITGITLLSQDKKQISVASVDAFLTTSTSTATSAPASKRAKRKGKGWAKKKHSGSQIAKDTVLLIEPGVCMSATTTPKGSKSHLPLDTTAFWPTVQPDHAQSATELSPSGPPGLLWMLTITNLNRTMTFDAALVPNTSPAPILKTTTDALTALNAVFPESLLSLDDVVHVPQPRVDQLAPALKKLFATRLVLGVSLYRANRTATSIEAVLDEFIPAQTQQ
eukprot:m.75701 g.75701  ORF g.75701 m.75701 type:complete len:251 (+) comp13992_c4_seq3:790-1542(+)